MTNPVGTEVQLIAVMAAVFLAAAYVLWAVVARFFARGKACGSSCSGCGGSEKSLGEPKSFVGIEALSPPRK